MFVIVSGTSGSGKTTLVNMLLEKGGFIHLHKVTTYTTRPPREGEVDGEDYYFISEKRFKEMEEDNEFMESANVYGYHYGTPVLWSGRSIFLIITDVQGFRTLKNRIKEPLASFFITNSKYQEHLLKRNTEDEKAIQTRLAVAQEELKVASEYDYVIDNDNLDSSLEILKSKILEEWKKK